MAEPLINRVYDLRIAGYDDAIQKVEALTLAFKAMDETKRKLNAQLQQKLDSGDQTAVTELTKNIKDLEVEMAKLKTQRDSAGKEAALLAKAEKDSAAALLLTEKATVATATAEKIRATTRIAQTAEQQKQLDLEEKQRIKLENEKKAVDALEGSYTLLKQRRQELEALTGKSNITSTITFDNQTFTQDEAIAKIKQMKAEELDYTEKLKLEKVVHEDIIKTQQQEILSIQKQRVELETLISQANQNKTSNVSFQGNNISIDEAITKAHQLEQAENQLTSKLLVQQQEIKSLPGNYYALVQAQKQALELYRITPSTSPFFEEVKQGAIKASHEVAAFNRTLSPDGTLVGEYKTGIINAFKELGLSDVLRKQRDEINSQLGKLKVESQALAAEYRKTGLAGKESFDQIETQLKQNIESQEQMKKSLNSLDSALNNTGNVGTQISNSIANGFKNAKTQISQLLLGYVGFQAVFSGLQSGVGITKELADSTSNLEIELGKTAGGASKIVDELSKINTRTKLTGLEDIANIAARAGVSEEKLVGVTQAIDKIKIAFGRDFGDVEQGTESLVKLVNIFEGADQVTGENLLKVGNAVRTLANESVASVPFLNDFSKRMAGLKGISDISLPSVLGLASGFEQFGQSAEVSSTALVRIIPKLASDTAKFSEVAGVTQKEFSELLKNNPAEALIKVAQGFTAGKGSIEEFEAAFKDSGLGTGRVSSVIGVLGKQADEFRHSIDSAGKAFSNTTNIETAFTTKNENLAATLDKIGKKFSDAAGTKTFQLAITAVASVVTLLITNLPTLLTILGVLTISWAVQNTALIALRAQVLGYNLLIGASAVLQGVLTVANGIYIAGLFLLNGAYAIVTRAAAIFNLTIGRTPLGLVLTGIGLLISAYEAFGTGLSDSIEGLNNFNEAARINRDVIAEAARATSEARAQAQLYVKVVKDTTISEATRLSTLQKLIAIDPAFQAALVNGKINYLELDKALSQYNNSLIKSSELEAAKARQSGEFKKLTDLQVIKQDIEFAKSSRDLSNLGDEAKNLLAAAAIKNKTLLGGADLSTAGLLKQADNAIELINIEIDKQGKTVDASQKVFIEKQKKIDDDIAARNAKAQADASKTPPKIIPAEIDVDGLKKQIEAYDEQINAFKGSQKDLDKLIADRKKLQDALDAALGKDDTGKPKIFRGSKLTGEQKDAFKDIDAIKDEQITEQKLLFKQLTIDEETYLKNILKINEDAADKKLAILRSKDISKLNAEERKQIAELQLFKIEQEEETNKQIFDIRKKSLDSQLDEIKKTSEIELAKVTDDPTKTNQEKLKARQSFLTQEYIIQFVYNKQVDDLEKFYNQRSIENNRKRHDEILNIQKDINKNELEITVGTLTEIDDATELAISKIKIKYDQLKEEILKSSKSVNDKESAITILTKVETVEVGGRQLLGDNDKVAAAKKLLEAGLITSQQFEVIYDKAIKGQEALNKAILDGKKNITSFKELLTNTLSNLFGFAEGSDKQKLLGQTIAGAFNTATEAMNNFFDAEKNRIDQSNRVTQQRLDIELQQAQSRADSQAEQDSLARQFQVKKDAADRAAFERNKKLQIAQAEINLAIQLANLAVIAFAPSPLNIATLGVAGAILYGVQAAIAFANFALNVNRIKSAQYAGGGRVRKEDETTVQNVPNGRITLPQNIPTQPNGDNVLATVKTNEVILNEEQQRRLGGPKVFRDIGVPGFAGGGAVAPDVNNTNDPDRQGISIALETNLKKEINELLTGDKNEIFKFIDDQRERKIQSEKQSFKELLIDEVSYLKNVFSINEEATNRKITLLEYKNIHRSTDIEQRRQAAELQIYKIEEEAKTKREIFSIQRNLLNSVFETTTKKSQLDINKINENDGISEQVKQRAVGSIIQQDYITLALYNKETERLEKEYALFDQSYKISRSVIDKVSIETLKDIHEATELSVTKIKTKYDAIKEEILSSSNSERAKKTAINTVEKIENIEINSRKLTGENNKIHAVNKLLETRHIQSDQFENIFNKATEIHQQLTSDISEGKKTITSNKLFSNKIRNLSTVLKVTDQSAINPDKISKVFTSARESINNFYSLAKSDAASKNTLDRKEGLQKSSSKISRENTGLEIKLSKIALSSFAPSIINKATLGIAGAIEYGSRAAIVSVNYALSKQFAIGGLIKPEKIHNGRITTTPNIEELPNGDNIFATVRKGEVILNEEQQRKLGGARTFRAIGVPGFGTGGLTILEKEKIIKEKIRAFASGGFTGLGDINLGDNLHPPINPSSFLNPQSAGAGNDTSKIFAAINQQTDNINTLARQTNQRIDKIQVMLDPNAVQKANDKTKKASAIGTL